MRDGVKLATDIYRPVSMSGKLPVILTRLPYNKNGAQKQGEYFARHGYVFVAQDTRGRYASDGVWHWMTDDAPDGVDCAKWIIRQSWSDGKIGMIGTSYVGGTQHAMALASAPGLATVIPVDAVSNGGVQSMRNAGAFEMRFWNWIMLNGGKGSNAAQDPGTEAVLKEMADNRLSYIANLPLRRGATPLKLAPEYEEWLINAMRHGANDEFWGQNNIIDHATGYKDIPVYLVGGWYDSWAGNTTSNFRALTPVLKSDVFLIMGPWIHGQQAKSSHGMVAFLAGKQPSPMNWHGASNGMITHSKAKPTASARLRPLRKKSATSPWEPAMATRLTRGCFIMVGNGTIQTFGRLPGFSQLPFISALTARCLEKNRRVNRASPLIRNCLCQPSAGTSPAVMASCCRALGINAAGRMCGTGHSLCHFLHAMTSSFFKRSR